MTDRPIIFSAPMVRALIDGRKTMTRRLALAKCPGRKGDPCIRCNETGFVPTPWQRTKPGDRLWVRESFATPYRRTETSPGTIYRADGPEYLSLASAAHQWGAGERWTPSIHMPRWASRITLIVTATKIEPLQEISKPDCIAEGMTGLQDVHAGWHQTFAALWEKLHGVGSWDKNPKVVAIAFKVHKANIDALSAAA